MKSSIRLFAFLRKAAVVGAACLAIAGCTAVPEPRDTSHLVAVPKRPEIQPKRPTSPSPFGSLFQSKEPKKPNNVVDWMGQDRLDM